MVQFFDSHCILYTAVVLVTEIWLTYSVCIVGVTSRMDILKRNVSWWRLKRVIVTVITVAVVTVVVIALLQSLYPDLYVHTSYNLQLSNNNNNNNNNPKTLFIMLSSINESVVLFPKKPLVIWSNDYHIAPINDLKHLLKPLGVRFIDKSLSGHCHVTDTCEGKKSLKIINRDNAMNLDTSLISKFYEAYKNDTELQSVDAFVCFHPASMCELFMPFNKSLIVIASTRYELGRFGADRWRRWNSNLVQIAKTPTNVVGGNNRYDVEYIKYFTGIQPQLLPSFCGYLSNTYTPSRPGFLLAPVHHEGFERIIMSEYQRVCENISCTAKLTRLREIYPHYKYSDLTAHAGVVYVPYQVSVMSMFEQYRMNIPLFFPSLELLTTWQQQHMVRYKCWSLFTICTTSSSEYYAFFQ